MYGDTHVVEDAFTTNVHQSVCKVAVHHLQAIVQPPKGRSERVTDSSETTAGCGIGLEHNKRLADLLRNHSRVKHP